MRDDESKKPKIYLAEQLPLAISEALDLPPARKLSKKRYRVFQPSEKVLNIGSHSSMHLDHRSEGHAAMHKNFRHDIKYWKPQPFSIELRVRGKRRVYTADFLHQLIDGTHEIEEVKPARHFEDPDIKPLLKVMETLCERCGVRFLRTTAEWVGEQPRLGNLRLLYPHSGVKNHHLLSLVELLRKTGRAMSYGHIRRLDPRIDHCTIAVGLAQGVLESSHRFSFGEYFDVRLGGVR